MRDPNTIFDFWDHMTVKDVLYIVVLVLGVGMAYGSLRSQQVSDEQHLTATDNALIALQGKLDDRTVSREAQTATNIATTAQFDAIQKQLQDMRTEIFQIEQNTRR